jgi:tight adherence protein B
MSSLTALLTGVDAAPLLVSMGAGLTVLLVVAALATMRSPLRVRAANRVAAFGSLDRTYQPTASPLHDRRVSQVPLLEHLLGGRSWTDVTREKLARAGVPLRVGEYLALRVLAVSIGVAAGMMLARRAGGEPLAQLLFIAIGAGLGWVIPPIVVSMRLGRRHEQIETQLVELCDVMASMLESGYGYSQALHSTSEEVGPPLSTELQRLLDTVRLGGDIDEALDELNDRLGSRDFDMIASAIAIQRRSGGNLAEILSGVAETIRARQSFKREVRVLTSRERYSALIVAGFPFALIALLTWMAPDPYLLLFTDMYGRMILAVALVLDAIGFVIIRKLTQIEV